jgi:hypothetical protein
MASFGLKEFWRKKFLQSKGALYISSDCGLENPARTVTVSLVNMF